MTKKDSFTVPEFELLVEKVMLYLEDPRDYDRDKTKSIIRALCKVLEKDEIETIMTMKFKSFGVNECMKTNLVM